MLLISNFTFLLILIVEQKVIARRTIKRIVHGVDALPEEIPYQVSIENKHLTHFCGGSILNEKFIITAGHCAANLSQDNIRVAVGTTNLEDIKFVHNVTWIYIHEMFKKPHHYANDIALMKVSPSFKFNNLVSPVVLPEPHQVIPKHKKLLAAGWGSMKGSELSLPLILKKVEVTVVDQEYCSNLYRIINRTIYPTQMCTHDIGEKRIGVCIGDSGGGLTIDDKVLVGIISWSRKDPDCASPLYPDVHTRVSEYIDWINQYAV